MWFMPKQDYKVHSSTVSFVLKSQKYWYCIFIVPIRFLICWLQIICKAGMT